MKNNNDKTKKEERCEDLDKVLNAETESEVEKLSQALDEKCKHCKNEICEKNGQMEELLKKLGYEEDLLQTLDETKEEAKEEDLETLKKREKKIKIPKEFKESDIIYKAKERAIATAVIIKTLLDEGIDYESALGFGNNLIQTILQEEINKLQLITNRSSEI